MNNNNEISFKNLLIKYIIRITAKAVITIVKYELSGENYSGRIGIIVEYTHMMKCENGQDLYVTSFITVELRDMEL